MLSMPLHSVRNRYLDTDHWAAQIFELMQGKVLFNGKASPTGAWSEEEDQLAQMIELFGHLPLDFLRQGKYTTRYFTDEGTCPHRPHHPSSHINYKHNNKHPLGRLLHIGNNLHMSSLEDVLKFKMNPSLADADVPLCVSFLRGMLQYRPQDRKSAAEVAQDSWLCD